ncbi:MAG: sulfatase-like hydrolase/transferase, partial [Ruthenibacterium sp.]
MKTKPNVIFIYADDMGRGMLSCYGQKYYETPNIDRLCQGGLNFTNAHGCHICAPARASLMCGVHDSHCGKWQFTRAGIYKDYARGELTLEQVYELIHKTGIEERSGSRFLPMVFRDAGYVTGQIGKLEWGFATTGDAIKTHGWDYHYGYYDHEMCHGYYPPFVFEDGVRIDIPGNTQVNCGSDQYSQKTFCKNGDDLAMGRAVYAQDLFDEKIHAFLYKHSKEPFFLLHPSQLPHGALSVPTLHPSVKNNAELTLSEKLYASMVLRLDETVGKILRDMDELGIAENTMIVFGSDNGHCGYYTAERTGRPAITDIEGKKFNDLTSRYTSETAGDIFDGNNGMTGCKSTNFEGGTRVPLMYYWPGYVKPGVSDRLVANYDFMATMADLLGTDAGTDKDGTSYCGTLLDCWQNDRQQNYVVFASTRGPAIVTKDGWKLRSYITDDYKFSQFGAFWKEIDGQVLFE